MNAQNHVRLSPSFGLRRQANHILECSRFYSLFNIYVNINNGIWFCVFTLLELMRQRMYLYAHGGERETRKWRHRCRNCPMRVTSIKYIYVRRDWANKSIESLDCHKWNDRYQTELPSESDSARHDWYTLGIGGTSDTELFIFSHQRIRSD